jgi:hypothetical protein
VIFQELFLGLVSHPQELHGVSDNVLFDLEVERRVRREGWRMVDFDEPWLQFLVDEYVKAKNFEAEGIYAIALSIMHSFLLE